MDYLNIGANGFAQVGDPQYFAKCKVEMDYLITLIEDKFPVPETLQPHCFFGIKSFPHDFGTYHEIILYFDDNEISEDYEIEEDVFPNISSETIQNLVENNTPIPQASLTLHDIFWDWFHQIESFDLESDEITEAIKSKYSATLNTSNAEHLIIKRAS